jgi:hypothetical protein
LYISLNILIKVWIVMITVKVFLCANYNNKILYKKHIA